ncbi:MAG: cyclic-di-AMP receptor [Chloroflexota bacterium]
MKMMIVVVKDNDADAVTQALTEKEFRVTRVASTGGFLRSGIATLLIGVEDAQVEDAIQVLRGKLPPLATGEGRATLFVVPVERFEQV